MLLLTELTQKISRQNEEMFCFGMFVGIILYYYYDYDYYYYIDMKSSGSCEEQFSNNLSANCHTRQCTIPCVIFRFS